MIKDSGGIALCWALKINQSFPVFAPRTADKMLLSPLAHP